MISVRFHDTFRERLPEWISSLCLIGWGAVLLGESSFLWQQEYFSVLANIASQKVWGYTTIFIGVLRCVSLGINGALRPTAHLRAIGALVGALTWSAIFISYLGLDWNPPSMAPKMAMAALDVAALWYAAGDAKLADIKAKQDTTRIIPTPQLNEK